MFRIDPSELKQDEFGVYHIKLDPKYNRIYNQQKINEFYKDFAVLLKLNDGGITEAEFNHFGTNEKKEIIQKIIYQNRAKILDERHRLLTTSPAFIKTKYVSDMNEIIQRYNDILDLIK